jgi:hypothetical protein
MNEGTLLVIALATPLVMLAACLSKWARAAHAIAARPRAAAGICRGIAGG